jgi:hypothetical protein
MPINHVLDYAKVFANLDWEILEQICDNYDDGEAHSINEAKTVLDDFLANYTQRLQQQMDVAKEMRQDLAKMGKAKFLAKHYYRE